MSGTSQPVFYWDSCIYLAWLKEEQSHGKEHIQAMAQIVKENFELKNVIITSVITRVEVLSSKLTPDQEDKFKKTFRSSNHTLYDVDPPIADKAHNIRERAMADGKKPVSIADAIHLATAVIYGAKEFHTFDDGQKDKKYAGLLELSGAKCVDGLVICKPSLDQAVLDLPDAKKEAPEDPSLKQSERAFDFEEDSN